MFLPTHQETAGSKGLGIILKDKDCFLDNQRIAKE